MFSWGTAVPLFLFLDNKDIRNISKPKITFYHIKGGTFYEVKATTFNEVLVINP